MRIKSITLCVVLSGALCTTQAQDQKSYTNFQDTTFHLDEVSVTGAQQKKVEISKLNVPALFLPITTSTVSATMFEQRGIVNLQDAVKFLPGTRMRTTYGAYQQFQVRGYDYTPIMIDGVRDERTSITNSAPLPDLASVESIELLKGPASVLYGHSTVGGILNIVRKSPVARTTVNTRLSYGSWNDKRAMLDFGGKIVGPFNYRAVFNWSDTEGYRYTNDKRLSGYLALGAKLDDKQELDIRGGINRDNYGTEIGLPPLMANDIYRTDGSKYLSKGEMLPGLNPRSRYNNASDFMKHHSSNVAIKYKYRFSEGFKLENRLAYNYDNIDYFSTEILSYSTSSNPVYKHYYMVGNKKTYIDLDTVRLTRPLRFAYTVHTINEQLEGAGKITFGNGMRYNYLVGYNFVYFFRNIYRASGEDYKLSDLIEGPGLNSNVSVYNPQSMGYMEPYFGSGSATRNYTHGIYWQNLLEISDKFKVMFAGRFDHFIFKTAAAKIAKLKEREYTQLSPFSETSTSALTYRIGTVYLPVTNISIYASLANFFMPYRNIVNTATTIYIDANGNRFYPNSGEEAFKAQKGYQAEIGARYIFDSRFKATASAFYIRRENENKVLNSSYIDPIDRSKKTVVGQVAESDSKGFELELSYIPAENVMISAGYGYIDAKIRKFNFDADKLIKEGYMDQKIDLQDGVRLSGIPKNTFFAAGSYTITRGLFKHLAFNATVSYMDNVYRDLNKTIIYPAYWQSDLGISYALSNGIQLRMNINNLFDDRRFTQSLGTQVTPRTPRSYLFTVAYSL